MSQRFGFKAMMKGDGDKVSGWQTKLQAASTSVLPSGFIAEQHCRMTGTGSAEKIMSATTAREGGLALCLTRRPPLMSDQQQYLD